MQNAIWWVEMAGLDGLRLDTFPYVPRSFWHQYNGLLHQLYPQISEVGEVFNKDPHVTSFFAGGRANTGSDGTVDTLLDTPFDYPMFFALRGTLTHHAPMSAIADVLAQDGLYPHPERLVTFLGNHDNKRFLSEPGAGEQALHLGFGLLATLRGMPQLYYGDEIEMRGGDDPDNRKDFPGGFAGDARDAFMASGRTPEQEQMHAWVSAVMQLRARTPELQLGREQTLLADAGTLAFVRGPEAGESCATAPTLARYVVVANNDTQARDVNVPLENSAASHCTQANSALAETAQPPLSASIQANVLHVHLPAQEIGIFRLQP
jgi:glycosidase